MFSMIPQIIGLLAVLSFLLSYQQKERKNIILFNCISRSLYILQYLLLGAFSGALLDILGTISSVIAGQKHNGWIQKHGKLIWILLDASMIMTGIILAILHHSALDLLPVAGVLLHTGAFWISNEKVIRRISLLGSPFWFAYNLLNRAYGSALGDLLTIGSILVAMIKYRDWKPENVK